jgi:hypothetical protein
MIAKITYALVLFVHPNPEPRIYALFPTAEACRAERAAVISELNGAQITVACVPRNQISAREASSQIQELMDAMRLLDGGHSK